MRALVTGGAGFLGSNLVDRLLAEGHHVDIVDDFSTGGPANLSDARADRSHAPKLHQVSVSDASVEDVIERAAPDVVFHLVDRSGPASETLDDVDAVGALLSGALRVLRAARRTSVDKVVVAVPGASLLAGCTDTTPQKESAAPAPVDAAGSLAEATLAALTAHRAQHHLEFTGILLGDVYGRRQRRDRPIPTWVDAALTGTPAPRRWHASHVFDPVHVDDAVDALVRAVDRADGLVVNVSSGSGVDAPSLRARVESLAGQRVIDDEAADVMACRRVVLDNARAAIHLGWKPWTDLDDGLAEVLRVSRSGT